MVSDDDDCNFHKKTQEYIEQYNVTMHAAALMTRRLLDSRGAKIKRIGLVHVIVTIMQREKINK